jgi:methionyl-tRNA formyltransferase
MRIAIIGQQAFGKAVLDAFLARGDEVAGVFVAPAGTEPLGEAAAAQGLPVFPTKSYGAPEAIETLRRLAVDLAVMAYVVQFVPQSFCRVPRLGTIQFHPSLLPRHRGPSAINWAVIAGESRTGLSIFRPVDGLDEGPVILQKEVAIGADDTVASLYFDHIFPMGVAALLEAADLVAGGKAVERAQDESLATYEGWVREGESRIQWASPARLVYNLIRGCNPAPGAWTLAGGKRLNLFDARCRIVGRFSEVKGMVPGQVVATGPASFTVHAQGGFIEVLRCRLADGKKIAGGAAGVTPGMILG